MFESDYLDESVILAEGVLDNVKKRKMLNASMTMDYIKEQVKLFKRDVLYKYIKSDYTVDKNLKKDDKYLLKSLRNSRLFMKYYLGWGPNMDGILGSDIEIDRAIRKLNFELKNIEGLPVILIANKSKRSGELPGYIYASIPIKPPKSKYYKFCRLLNNSSKFNRGSSSYHLSKDTRTF